MRYSYRDEHIVGRKTDIVGGPPAVLIFLVFCDTPTTVDRWPWICSNSIVQEISPI
jgi:hypothetical protein